MNNWQSQIDETEKAPEIVKENDLLSDSQKKKKKKKKIIKKKGKEKSFMWNGDINAL